MSIRINRVYTRSGDDGSTGLVGGARLSKADPRVIAFGEVDEANSFIGYAKEKLPVECAELRAILEHLQQELFDLGSELATPLSAEYPQMWRASATDVTKLEQLCDRFGQGLPELTSFIIPGGSEIAALFHISRTVSRRAERAVVALDQALRADSSVGVNPEVIKYLNRLSDLLFIFARWSLGKEGKHTPLWEPAAKRQPF